VVGVTSVSGHDVLNVERVPSVDQTSAAPFLPADPTVRVPETRIVFGWRVGREQVSV